jgi:hypothetical protein
LLLAVACSRGGGGAAPTPGPCASRRPPAGPDVVTSLRAEDSGTTLCVHVGEAFSVFLSGPVAGPFWARVDSSRGSVLERRPTNQLTLARGVTAAIFVGKKAGVTELSSVRPPCSDPHGSGCDATTAWTAVVVVSR